MSGISSETPSAESMITTTSKLEPPFSTPSNSEVMSVSSISYKSSFDVSNLRILTGIGTGETAALKVFQDVCSRTMMLNMLVNDTTGKAGIITGNAGPALDFGQDDKNAVAALDQACPEEHVMAGMMG